jgi:hypothetical protein
MPRLIDPPAGSTLDLEEVTARLDESGVDLADEAIIAHCAALLAGLQVPWRDQYIVDLDHGTIAKRPTLTSGEMLLRCAVHLTENGRDVAEQFARVHPVPRVRANAIGALAAVAKGEGRVAVLERGLRDGDARVRDDCERWLAL